MAEHEQHKAAVTSIIAASLDGLHELFNLKAGEVFSFVVHQSLGTFNQTGALAWVGRDTVPFWHSNTPMSADQ